METGVVIIQEPVSTKTHVEEAPVGVILDHLSKEIQKVNLSTVLDDEITSRDCGNNIIPGEADASEVVNGSGTKETEESEREKGDAEEIILVEDSKIVKVKASETEKDEQDSIFVHEPESFNTNTKDEKIILSDVTLEKEKEENITREPEEVIDEDQPETINSQEEEIGKISKVLIDTVPVKFEEGETNSAREEIPIKTDEVTEEKDSRTVETSVNGTEAEHNATVSIEEISRNSENIVNETVPEEETATHDVETTKSVILEAEKEEDKEEMKIDAEPKLNAIEKVETANVMTVIDDPKIVNREATVHESESLKETAEPVEAIKISDDAKQISSEVTADREKEEVQESLRVIETPTIQEEDIETKASLNHEEEIDSEGHEHVLGQNMPQSKILVTETESADTSTVQEAAILKTLETNINEKEAVNSEMGGKEEGQETKEDTKLSLDLKEHKEQEETEMVTTVISYDEVRSYNGQAEVVGEHTGPCSSEIKDESHGREDVEVKSQDTVQEESNEEKHENLLDVPSTESEKCQENEPETALVTNTESPEKSEEIPSDLALKDDEIEVDQVDGTQTVEEQRGLDSDEPEAEQIDRNRTDVTEESPVEKLVALPDVESVEQTQKLESPSEVSEETSKTVDEKIEEKPEEEVTPHQESQEEGSYGLETKEETVSIPESIEIEERSVTDLSPLQEESCLNNDQEKETKLGNHEPILLVVPSTKSEKYQENEPKAALVANTESREKSEEIPSDLALNVEKEELKDDEIEVDQVDGTQTVEEQRGLDMNESETEQIDRNRTDETEESLVEKLVALPDVESVEQMQNPSLESPSEISEETSKTVEEKIEEKQEEEVTRHQEGKEEGSYGLESVSVPESIELEEKSQEERSVIDLTPLQEESCLPNEQETETKLEKHEPTNEEVKSDKVIEVSSASPTKELESETVVEGEKIENTKENEEEQTADKIQRSLETAETVESHSSLPSSLEEQEHETVPEKIEDDKVKEEEPMVQIKSEEDTTESHERQEEFSKAGETTVVQAGQTRDIGPSLTEKCYMDQTQPEEQVKEACSRDEQEEEKVNEACFRYVAEEETTTNGEALHDVETTKGVLLEVEKEEEEEKMKTDAEPSLVTRGKEETETAKTVAEDTKIFNNEETTAHESESIKNSDDVEQISSEVTGDREKKEDINQEAKEVQETPRVIETPTIQGEEVESKASLELKEEVDQSSKDTEEHENLLGRDVTQCETLEAEAVDTSKVQEAVILNTKENNINETEAVHSAIGGKEEGQETKEDTKPSLDLKEDKETETVKNVILFDEVRPTDQVDAQAEEFGEHTESCSSEIKDESQEREESVDVKAKETIQEESNEEKDVKLLDVPSVESEKYHDNEPETSLVSVTESRDNFEEIPSDLSLKTGQDLNGTETERSDRDKTDETEESPVEKVVVDEGGGLDETTQNQNLPDVESVEKIHMPTLESPELSEETSKTVDEKIEEKPKEEVKLHQEGQEETVSVPDSSELGEKVQEEESCLPNEEEKETNLQKEKIEKHEPTKEEVPYDQQSLVEEKSDKVIQVSSAVPSEERDGETIVEDGKIEDVKANEEEQVADKIQRSLESVEIAKLHNSLPSSSEEQEHETVLEAEKIEDIKANEEEEVADKIQRSLESVEIAEPHSSFPSSSEEQEHETVVEAEKIEDVKVNEEEQVADKIQRSFESVEIAEPHRSLPLSSEEQEHGTVAVAKKTEDEKVTEAENESEKGLEIAETTDLSLPFIEHKKESKYFYEEIQIPSVVSALEENIEAPKLEESKEVKSQKISETAEATEPTGDKTLPIETLQAEETPSSELVSELNDQIPRKVVEIHEEETKEADKLQVAVDQIIQVETSQADQTPSLVQEQEDHVPKKVKETHEEEEESYLPNIEEKGTKFQDKIEKHETTKEEVPYDQQSPVEEKSDEVKQVFSASPSEEQEDETVVEAEKIEDLQANVEEQVAEKIQRSLESVEIAEPHSSLPSSSEEKEHETAVEAKKTEDEKVTEAEPTEDVSEKGLEIAETTDPSLLFIEQKKEIKDFDEEIQIPSVASPLDENIEAPKLEELKEDKSQEISETTEATEPTGDMTLPIEISQAEQTPSLVPEQEDHVPKKAEETHEEQEEIIPTETVPNLEESKEEKSQEITETTEAIEATGDQTPKQLEEIHEEETKEVRNLQDEEILPTETVPKESFSEAPISMLASGEDKPVTLQEGHCAAEVRDTNDTQEERSVSAETEPKDIQDLATEVTKVEDEINQEEFKNSEAPKLEEPKEDKSQEILETIDIKAIVGTCDQTLPIETSKVDQTLSSGLVSGLDDQTPRQVEEIHDEETKEERKFEATSDQSLRTETSQEDQTPKEVEEIHEEEKKEAHKLEVVSDQILQVEISQADQTPSLVPEKENQIPKQVEEIHEKIQEEETKEAHNAQAKEILFTGAVLREAPVSMLPTEEDKPVTPQEGHCAADTQEEQHVSAETEERVGETKPKEPEAEGTEKSDDEVETSTKLTKEDDETTTKTDIKVAELTNGKSMSNAQENACLKQEELKDIGTIQHGAVTGETEHEDENSSTLPVVEILKGLQTTLETERAIDDSTLETERAIDTEVESNEKESASEIIEANRLQHDESGETEKIQEENSIAGKSLSNEESNLQEEDKEEVKVQDVISREFEVSVEDKLQEEEAKEIAEHKEQQEEHPRDFEILKKVGDNSDQVMESKLPEDQPQTEKKKEIHETVKEEDQTVDIKEVETSEEVQYQKLVGLSATRDTEETFSSEVKKDQEDENELGVDHEFTFPHVEKPKEPHSQLGNDEEINKIVTPEKKITDPVVIIKKAELEANEEHAEPQAKHEEHVELQAISNDSKTDHEKEFPTEQATKDQREEVNADKSLTKEAPGEKIQVPSAALLDQPKGFEASVTDKDTTEQERKSNDILTYVQEDNGTNVKPEVLDDETKGNGHDSVVELKEEADLIEKKREVEYVKTELEDAIKHGVPVEEKNDASEKIDREATKEIYQAESKQTDTLTTIKEETKEEEKKTAQECFNSMKNTDDAIEKTQHETREIESLSSVSNTQEISEQEDEVPNQQNREIADEVPKLKNLKIGEESQQKDGESEKNNGLFSEVKETEPTVKEPARKSLSDLIQKVKEPNKIEDATKEEPKTEEEEDEDGDHEHKDDKTSPDSLVMVEAKDTVSIIKTHPKKSQGILSGVSSKVKHSISKVKKVLTGKSSHTTKPTSPK